MHDKILKKIDLLQDRKLAEILRLIVQLIIATKRDMKYQDSRYDAE